MIENQITSETPVCGRRLRRTREELGLSLDDVAAELHLSHFQIEALETDNWERLPGTTYARGYLKSYARLLGLDAEQLLSGASTQEIEISRVEPELRARSPKPAPSAAPDPEREPAASRGTPWGWVAGVVVVCALALLSWQYPQPKEWLSGIAGGLTALSDGQTRTTASADGAAAKPESSLSEAGNPAAMMEPIDMVRNRVSDEAAMSARAPTPTQPKFVVFEFQERSWIDVRDARGDRLLYRDFQPGRRIEIEGSPPFRVFLGNAKGVQVEYLGGIVDPGTASERLYARFVLGAPPG